MIDDLLRDGYQIKTRWAGCGASTLWRWADFFTSLEKAKKFKTTHQNRTEPMLGWKLEIEIFRIERLDSV